MLTNTARLFALAALLTTGCSGEIDVANAAGQSEAEEGDSQETTDFDVDSAIVGKKARVTASALNLRSGPSTNYGILAVMPNGTIVDVVGASSGWYKVNWNGRVGWCSGVYLTPVGGDDNIGNDSAIDKAIDRARSGVGFSYRWGGGCWSPGSSQKGACYGSCPNCTHSGQWGADCSGYASKVWQVPGAVAVTTCSHPYSTWHFVNQRDHWRAIPRSSARRGDAFVYNKNGAGHIFIYEGGDPWGSMKAYEARGCSYGIVHNSRTAGSDYMVIRREGY